ncbi:tRNA lysidine(34) synthetase TilS [Simiduia sp. 21SJ11W-1]|uniref:tRNA lysidine(34) synthetase TilS n=1 Tax=Simiduia sp. 21SJ11W-1 TaxID=2909669 RepID=UPI00209E3644|nr:tRNA lysidine(34) synthetase TilS [Simiduia sp. 21SJ11W-1]UTA49141.1 tRNA lysidine(34) synthetase TilS [Simiduia sp. 21SJ11W-1]
MNNSSGAKPAASRPDWLAAFGERLRRDFPDVFAAQKLSVALSGGLDSAVLLHLLAGLGLPVHAIHVNHQLSPNADAWQSHCEQLCASLDVPFEAHRVTVAARGRGLEDAARASRYQVFEQALAHGGLLVTAHHQDDQAETLLLRLLRGAGVEGMGAMAARRPLAAGELVRPLLAVPRKQLEQWAHTLGVRYVEDESNSDEALDRNYLRHRVLPLLHERWPAAARQLAAAAELSGESRVLLADLAELDAARLDAARLDAARLDAARLDAARLDAARLDIRPERLGESIDLAVLAGLSALRQKNLVRHWLAQRSLVLSRVQLAQLLQLWLVAEADTQPQLLLATPGGQVRFYRYQRRGYLIRLGHSKGDAASWSLPAGPLYPERSYRFNTALGVMGLAMRAASTGLALPDAGHWWLRSRQAGDRCQPAHRNRSQTLKKCLQESGLVPWLRPMTPLVCNPQNPQQIWAAGDLWLDRDAPLAEAGGYQLHWWFEGDL